MNPPNLLKSAPTGEDTAQTIPMENTDVFTWSPTDMLGNDPKVICHKLSIRADAKLVKQKPIRMSEERSHAISDEINWLLKASFIQETFYPDWLSNPVLVKKNRK